MPRPDHAANCEKMRSGPRADVRGARKRQVRSRTAVQDASLPDFLTLQNNIGSSAHREKDASVNLTAIPVP